MGQPITTSVIIPCHNVAKTIGLQLECLAEQVTGEPFEVLIVDNKSTDNTREVAAQWADQLNLRIVDASQHVGVSYARNRGIGEAQGWKLIFIDGDDAVPTHYIEYCQRSLDEVPVYVSGFDPVDAAEFEGGREHVFSLISHKLLPYSSPLASEADPSWPILPGCSFGALKSVLVDLGGFDVAYEPGAEDNELAFRFMESGYELKVQRSTTIAYRVTPPGSRSFKRYYLGAKSTALLMTSKNVWTMNNTNSLKVGVRTIRAIGAYALALLGNKESLLAAKSRLATELGIAFGYFQYKILGFTPTLLPGRGIKGAGL